MNGSQADVGRAIAHVPRALPLHPPRSHPSPLSCTDLAVMSEGEIAKSSRFPAKNVCLDLVDSVPTQALFERQYVHEADPAVGSALCFDARSSNVTLPPNATLPFVSAPTRHAQPRLSIERGQESFEVVRRHRDIGIGNDANVNTGLSERTHAGMNRAYDGRSTGSNRFANKRDSLNPTMARGEIASDLESFVGRTAIDDDPPCWTNRLTQQRGGESRKILCLISRRRHNSVCACCPFSVCACYPSASAETPH